MPEYLSPGVYVEEIDTGPVPIEGVSTSTAGFVGMTAQGPVDGLPPVLVTSFSEYTRTFGGYLPASYGDMRFLPYAVQGFFENGGQRVYIKRVVPSGGPIPATNQKLKGGLITRLSKDVAVGSTQAQLSTTRGIQKGSKLTLTQVKNGITTTQTVTATGYNDKKKTVWWAEKITGSVNYEARYTAVTIPIPPTIIQLSNDLPSGATSAQLSTLRQIQVGTLLTFTQGANSEQVTITSIDSGSNTVHWADAQKLKNSYTVAPTTVAVPLPNPPIIQLSNDLPSGATSAQLSTLRQIQVGTLLTFTQGANSEQVTITSIDSGSNTIHWADAQKLKNSYTVTTIITTFTINAINAGAWGNALAIQVFQTSTGRAQVQVPRLAESTLNSGNYDTVLMNSASTFYPGAIVEFNKGNTKVYGKVKTVVGTNIVLNTPLDAKALDPDLAGFTTTASTCEFHLTAANNGIVEDYPILTMDSQTPYYVGNMINNHSSLISVTGSDDTGEDPFTMPSASDGLNITMGSGADSSSTITFDARDYIGTDNGPGHRTGIQALADIEEISIIAAPGITDQDVQNELINQCTLLRYRFAILDPLYRKDTPLDDIIAQRLLYDTHYAALYFPNVVNIDPNPASPAGSTIILPPSGHIAGIYAQTDDSRGVYKAPANVVIQGITDLELNITKGEQDILNPPPNQINVLRNFRTQGRGLRVWGARCITSDAQWKYVNVRRLFIFVEHSLDQGTQWVVFEPNDQPLWARVTQSISNFLTSIWHDGALMGQKAEEAFFVRCDRTTMTQDDIDNGRLIILVGIAPVEPAEFVIIRISQFTATASATGQ